MSFISTIPNFEEFLIASSFLLLFFMLMMLSYYGLKMVGFFNQEKKQ